MRYLLAISEKQFIAQSIWSTSSELNVEHAPSSVDQLLATFGAHHRVSIKKVQTAHAATNPVTTYNDIRSRGIVFGMSLK
jgi:hypothetical protein